MFHVLWRHPIGALASSIWMIAGNCPNFGGNVGKWVGAMIQAEVRAHLAAMKPAERLVPPITGRSPSVPFRCSPIASNIVPRRQKRRPRQAAPMGAKAREHKCTGKVHCHRSGGYAATVAGDCQQFAKELIGDLGQAAYPVLYVYGLLVGMVAVDADIIPIDVDSDGAPFLLPTEFVGCRFGTGGNNLIAADSAIRKGVCDHTQRQHQASRPFAKWSGHGSDQIYAGERPALGTQRTSMPTLTLVRSLGVKRTPLVRALMSASDPKQTQQRPQ